MIANIDAEKVVLAAMIQDAGQIDRIADIVQPEDFSSELLTRLFRACHDSHVAGKSASIVAVNGMFEGDAAYEAAGGRKFAAELSGIPGATIGALGIAKQIADLARRRRVAEGLAEAIEMAADQSVPLAETVEAADAALGAAADTSASVTHYSAAGAIDAMLAQLDSKDRGVTCKVIPPMDELLGGARRKQMIILAARPGMGKTAVALSYSIGAAMNGHGVLYISLEMSAAELGARQAADMCFDGERGVPFASIVNQRVTTDDYRKLRNARDMAADLPLEIVDASALSVARLNVMVRRQVRKFAAKGERLDLVVVDYLQLLSAGKGKSAYETVSEISRALKAIAKEHDVAVLALAQLSREVEKRTDRRPQLSDLRDSGQIEQDADTVMFLLRPEYYLRREQLDPTDHDYPKWEAAMFEHAGKIEFICAKRRNGETGAGKGAFHGAYQAVRGL